MEEEGYEIRIVFRLLLTPFDSDSNIVLIAIGTTLYSRVSRDGYLFYRCQMYDIEWKRNSVFK